MCGTLLSTKSNPEVMTSSNPSGIKSELTVAGSDDLKSPIAAQHRVAVDHGDTYRASSMSMTCAPSGLRAGDSGEIILLNARICSVREEFSDDAIVDHLKRSAGSKEERGS